MLISDMATRLAYAVRDGAAQLRRSKSETLVLSVANAGQARDNLG